MHGCDAQFHSHCLDAYVQSTKQNESMSLLLKVMKSELLLLHQAELHLTCMQEQCGRLVGVEGKPNTQPSKSMNQGIMVLLV